jgi:type IV pilus assembly protein PilC
MTKTFAYKARDSLGQAVVGSIMAENETAAAAFIRDKGYYVTKIKVENQAPTWFKSVPGVQSVSLKDLALFCRQFATMIDAGLALVACLKILIDQADNRRLKAAIKEIQRRVQEGESLHRTMADQPSIFPQVMVSMVEAGELSGALDVVLDRLALQFEKEYKLAEKIRSAMTYPLVVLTMAVLSVIFILTFVLPPFITLFLSMRLALPWPTRLLLAISDFLQHDWWILVSGLVGALIAMAYARRQPRVQLIADQVLLHLPVFGGLHRKIAIARFSRLLSTLVRGGVPILRALEVVKKTTGSPVMMEALTSAQSSIREGLSLVAPFSSNKIFNGMVVQMIAVGEETGALDKMLAKIADFYDSEIDDVVSRLSSMLEPVMIGILGVIIGLMVIAIILPLFDMIANFNQSV